MAYIEEELHSFFANKTESYLLESFPVIPDITDIDKGCSGAGSV